MSDGRPWKDRTQKEINDELARVNSFLEGSGLTRAQRRNYNQKKRRLQAALLNRGTTRSGIGGRGGGGRSTNSGRGQLIGTYQGNRPSVRSFGRNTASTLLSDSFSKQWRGMDVNAARYISAVLDPATFVGEVPRIPMRFPYPTATLNMKFEQAFTANASGNFAVLFQPQCGSDGGGTPYYDYVQVLNHASFTSANNWTQAAQLPIPMFKYDAAKMKNTQAVKYRVVGASMTVQYVGPADVAAGVMIGAFVPRAIQRTDGVPTSCWAPDALKEQMFSAETRVGQGVGALEIIYTPREDVDLDFQTVSAVGRETSCGVVLGTGCPTNANAFLVSVTVLVEYVPTVDNYIASIDSAKPNGRAMEILQEAIQKAPGYPVSAPGPEQLGKQIEASLTEKAESGAVERIGSLLNSWTDKASMKTAFDALKFTASMLV